MCETNPIRPGPIPEPGATAPNKPNCSLGCGYQRDGTCDIASMPRFGKQSQFPSAKRNRWGKPHPTRGCNRAKTNPIRPGPVWEPGATAPNKTNSARPAGSMASGKCTNKANSVCPGARGACRCEQTKPIWPDGPWGTPGAGGVQGFLLQTLHFKLHTAAVPPDRSCETKPISGGSGLGVAGRCPVYKQTQSGRVGSQAGAPEGECAKQSQLPEAGHRGGVRLSACPTDLEQTIASGARQSAPVRQPRSSRRLSAG